MVQESRCATSCQLDKPVEIFGPPTSSAPLNTSRVLGNLNEMVRNTFRSVSLARLDRKISLKLWLYKYEGPGFDSLLGARVYSVWSLHVCLSSIWVSSFLPKVQRHAFGGYLHR